MISRHFTKHVLQAVGALTLSCTQSIATAGTITFFDAGSLSVGLSPDIIARGSTSICTPGVTVQTCTVTLMPPTTPFFGGSAFTNWTILDQFSNLISDEINVTPTFDVNFNAQKFTIVFTSYDPGITATPTGNIIREDGTVQSVGGGVWWFPNSGMVLDEIFFQSTDAPEPATFVLIGVGLATAGLLRRRRRTCL